MSLSSAQPPVGAVAKKKVILNLNLQKGSFVNPKVASDGKERDLEREEGGDIIGKLQRERLGGKTGWRTSVRRCRRQERI